MNYPIEEFYKKIKIRRDELDISQGDLANKLNIKQGYLSQIEHGNAIPSLELARKLAIALKEPINEYESWTIRAKLPKEKQEIMEQEFAKKYGTKAKVSDITLTEEDLKKNSFSEEEVVRQYLRKRGFTEEEIEDWLDTLDYKSKRKARKIMDVEK